MEISAMSHLVLVDGNNLGFSAMANPKLTAGSQATQGTFTFIRKIRSLYIDYPEALIMVLWDGKSWRNDIYAEYKDKRQSTDKQQKVREEYYDQKDDMIKALTYLGVPQCFSINMEADDLAEIYSRKWNGGRVTLISGDGDWIQLVDDKVTWIDPIRNRMVNTENFQEFTGYKDAAQFVEAKSILGDKDEVPGIKGIGPAKLEVIYNKLNMSFREFMDWHLSFPKESREEWKRVTGKNMPQTVSDVCSVETFKQLDFNDKLGDLRTPHRPEPIDLKRKQSAPDIAAFEDLCYKLSFLSITRKLDMFTGAFINNRYTINNR